MEYKGYKIESIKNDGHLQRNAFGIYKNGKLISTATTSKEAQHEIDNIERELKDMKTIDKLDKAIKSLDSWTSAYKQFEDIVDKYFPQVSKINAEVKKLYEKHKGEQDFEEAYKRWKNQQFLMRYIM